MSSKRDHSGRMASVCFPQFSGESVEEAYTMTYLGEVLAYAQPPSSPHGPKLAYLQHSCLASALSLGHSEVFLLTKTSMKNQICHSFISETSLPRDYLTSVLVRFGSQ